VICCRNNADKVMAAMTGMMSRLKLTVNESKTHVCQIPQESFDFPGQDGQPPGSPMSTCIKSWG